MSAGRGRPASAIGVLIIAASFVAGGYLLLQYMGAGQKERIARLEELASKLKSESVPVKFKILSKDSDKIEARVRIYDLSGSEIAVVERSWPGSSLYIDMLLVPLVSETLSRGSAVPAAPAYLAFPYRIFTDRVSPASGTSLFEAYDRDGFPRVLDGVEWTSSERAAIAAAFKAAKASASAGEPATSTAEGAFGSAVHEAVGMPSLEAGIVYKVVCRAKGGVEIMEE
jgi:hypothetical protein